MFRDRVLVAALAMLSRHRFPDFAAQQPEPRVPMGRGDPVLEIPRADGRDNLSLR